MDHDSSAIPTQRLIDAISENNRHAISYLINKGVDVNGDCEHGLKPIHYASGLGNLYAAKLLLENGADPNVQTPNSHKTALDTARENGDKHMITLLLSHTNKLSVAEKGEKNQGYSV